MKLHTHVHPKSILEIMEMTPRHFHRLPWVNPIDLPLDAELQVFRWDDELGVVYFGDFGLYKCLPERKFILVVSLIYQRNEDALNAEPRIIH